MNKIKELFPENTKVWVRNGKMPYIGIYEQEIDPWENGIKISTIPIENWGEDFYDKERIQTFYNWIDKIDPINLKLEDTMLTIRYPRIKNEENSST